MGKRKRDLRESGDDAAGASPGKKSFQDLKQNAPKDSRKPLQTICIQVVTGSYDRVLHGITATVDLSRLKGSNNSDGVEDVVSFADTFLFTAHASAIRCLALSPPVPVSSDEHASTKIVLASGSTDERINLYNISANTPSSTALSGIPMIPSLSSVAKLENPKNREIGALFHHSSAVTKLSFATKSKLLSASEDNTIAVSRSRDWSLLSTMKAPVPQAHGRPSGDTAAPGKTPAGINDFDFDSSMRIMISVGRGERCMRLWNLVTGKKAGALNFGKELLQAIGENRFHSGEGQKVLFKPDGEGFVIGFERSAVVFNMQSEVQGIILPISKTKFHQMRFLPGERSAILAISTEDGRIVFYNSQAPTAILNGTTKGYRQYERIGQLGGPSAGVSNRIKDFEILPMNDIQHQLLIVTAGSDGSIRVWHLDEEFSFSPASTSASEELVDEKGRQKDLVEGQGSPETAQAGCLLGRFETANRITCMKAFIMLPEVKDESGQKPLSADKKTKQARKLGRDHDENVSEGTNDNEAGQSDEDSTFEGFD